MKNPKWKCANDTGTHKVKFGGKFLTQWDGYHLTLEQSTGGTISADKLKGYQEQSANLSYTANQDYYFNGWQSTGANIQNNQVPFTQDTTAKGSFAYTNPTRVIHKTYNAAANTNAYWYVTGGNAVPFCDIVIPQSISANGYSAQYLDTIHAIHFKFKTVPITLNNYDYCYGFASYSTAGEAYWVDGKWEALQYDGRVEQGPAQTPEVLHDGSHYPKLSANRFPVLSFWLAKSTQINTDYAENINSGIYAKCDDWTTGWNDLKYLVQIKQGYNTDYNNDRTCYVSAYYNNNYVGSAWEGRYNLLYTKYMNAMGVFSATNNTAQSGYRINNVSYTNYYKVYHPVAGTAYYDMANFNNITNAKRWLDSL